MGEYPARKCLNCRRLFDPLSPYFFMCDRCKRCIEANHDDYFDGHGFGFTAQKPGGRGGS